MFALENWSALAVDAAKDAFGLPLAFLNVGTRVDLSMRQTCRADCGCCGFLWSYRMRYQQAGWHTEKAAGCEPASDLGWRASIPLERDMRLAYQDLQAGMAGEQLRS